MATKQTNAAGNFQVCFLVPNFAQQINYCSTQTWPVSTWIKISVQVFWDGRNMTVWYHPQLATGDFDTNPIRLFKGIPFYNSQITGVSKVEAYVYNPNVKFFLDEVNLCNDAGGSPYQPVSADTAVQMSQSLMLQSISGHVDFDFQRTHSTTTFSQTSNFRLKGGDTSKIDLLDLAKTTDSFQDWKETIAENPAPVIYVLKEVSYLFPNVVVGGYNQRDEMYNAVATFLTTVEDGEIIYNTSPDEAAPDKINPTNPT